MKRPLPCLWIALLVSLPVTLGYAEAGEPAAGLDMGNLTSQPTMLSTFGTIERVELDQHSLIISGQRYRVSQTAKVEIHGSYGAFTMLQPGMGIKFRLAMYKGSEDVITEIYQTEEIIPM